MKKELLETQKTRNDLMRWKLLLVAAIGSAGLGFSGASTPAHAVLALSIIPLACCYADLLCRNLSIRSKLISSFLSAEGTLHPDGTAVRYERFYQSFDAFRRQNGKGDALEGFALLYSTRLLSIAVVPAGILAYFDSPWTCHLTEWPALLFIGSGAGGLLLSWAVEREYEAQRTMIDKTVKEWTKSGP